MSLREFKKLRARTEQSLVEESSRPTYYSHQRGDQPFSLVPYGLLLRAVTPAQPDPEPRHLWESYDLAGVTGPPLHADRSSRIGAMLYLIRRASYHAFLGERSEALEFIGRARELADGSSAGHLSIGSWLLSWDELDAAATDLAKATGDPSIAGDAWFGLGMVRARQGHPKRAAEALREALRLGTSKSQRARIVLAAALAESGDLEGARAVAEQVLAVNPDEPKTLELLRRIGGRRTRDDAASRARGADR
jgi:tetratricopeptide (TPR) repeat protein